MACLRRTSSFGWLLAAALVFCTPVSVLGRGGPQLLPYLVRSEQGWIDWQQGLIYGVGRASVKANDGSRLHAMRAAQAAARANIVKLAYGIQLNDKDRIETYEGGRLALSVEAFIQDREVATEYVGHSADPHYEVTRAAPLTGIHGLTGELLPRLGAGIPASALAGPVAEPEDEDAPWLVLDARHLPGGERVTPALFPRVLSPSGEIVYRLSTADPRAVRRRGMAQYVTADGSFDDVSTETGPGDTARWLGWLLGVDEVRAEEGQHRKRRRKFVVHKVEDLEGLSKTNLVVSEQDARRLKEEDASTKILKKCRVIVVVSGTVGGIEGRLPKGPTRLVHAGR
jgi:hypothetical protein